MLTSGGSNEVQLATNSTVRLAITSIGTVTQTLDATGEAIRDHGVAGVNRTVQTKRVTTTVDATPTNVYTYSMVDNSALMWEVKAYCYVTTDPTKRAYFHWKGYFNRNGGAPTADDASAVSADKVIGGWGPPAITIAAGTPTANDVSLRVTGVAATSIKWIVTGIDIRVGTTAA
jgi:hypothetical protein